MTNEYLHNTDFNLIYRQIKPILIEFALILFTKLNKTINIQSRANFELEFPSSNHSSSCSVQVEHFGRNLTRPWPACDCVYHLGTIEAENHTQKSLQDISFILVLVSVSTLSAKKIPGFVISSLPPSPP